MSSAPEAEGSFRARAGALTLLYLASPLERSVLLTLLAEATTGAHVLDDVEVPDDGEAIAAVFADSYLVEPADPDLEPGDPIGPDTVMRPTPAGREVPFVAEVLQRWLNMRPAGSIELGADAAPVLAPLLTGWSSTVMHTIAASPATATEACHAIQTLDLSTVEARLESMEEVGHLEAFSDDRGETRYVASNWLRMGIAPLAAAARMELRHPPGDTAPIAVLDVQAAFLLTLPLLELPEGISGSCSLAVDLEPDVTGSPAGVTVHLEDGRVVSCKTQLDENADAWAAAPAASWLDAVIEKDVENIRSGGDLRLTGALLDALHETLFGASH